MLRTVSLRQDTNGNFRARKRLPDDVREEYGQRYGQRREAKFFAFAKSGTAAARQLFRDWEAEVNGRIAAIRAERTGEGIALTPRQARALAGEWYEWFIARQPESDLTKWEDLRDQVMTRLGMLLATTTGNEAIPTTYGAMTPNSEKRCIPFWRTSGRRRSS